MARFWELVTMMTCSMPAATASSTAYWMTGLSTSGSISFGCAFVAGRKRVPQPAAGKTALRTRIEPRVRTGSGSVARGYHRALSVPGGALPPSRIGGRRMQRSGERPDGRDERLRLIERGEVGRPSDHDPSRVRRDTGERRLCRPEEQVVFAVDQHARAGVGGETGPEAFADQGPQGDRAAVEVE